MTSVEGTILHLQRLSTEDGPGIRTTVFLKGCPLRCAWCHNPESISPYPELQWLEQRCIACKTCLSACPQKALTWSDEGAVRDRAVCQACGTCAEICPANAHELLGKRISVDKLARELLKDRAYFQSSGGGVTLSGGEPSMQPAFAMALLQVLHEKGIPTAMDTCGLCQPAVLERLVGQSDLILFDLKLLDTNLHRCWTRVENSRILENLLWLGAYLKEHQDKRLWIRTPLIPGATASEENISAIGAWLAQHLPGSIERWELCAFNNLCRDKYRRLRLDWTFAGTPLLDRTDLNQAGTWVRRSGFEPSRVFVTGTARLETA